MSRRVYYEHRKVSWGQIDKAIENGWEPTPHVSVPSSTEVFMRREKNTVPVTTISTKS